MATRLAEIPSSFVLLAEQISKRLQLTRLAPTTLLSSGYDDQRWNERLVLRLELRDEFAPLASPDDTELFSDDFAVLVALEQASDGAFADDDAGYSWPAHLGEVGICHYLVDENALAQVEAATAALAVVSDEARNKLRELIEAS